MRQRLVALMLCCLGGLWPTLAPAAEERFEARPVEVTTVSRTCPFAPGTPEARALRVCYDRARSALAEKLAPWLGDVAARAGANPGPEELRAFAFTALPATVEHEEVRTTDNAVTAVIGLRTETDLTGLSERLLSYAESAEAKGAALAEYRAAPKGEPGASGLLPPSGERMAAEIQSEIVDLRKRAMRDLRPGMSMADVQNILGDPKAVSQGALGPEAYVCAGYGRVFAVFRNGLLACLRDRLEYVPRYDGDCHCAGNLRSIIWGN